MIYLDHAATTPVLPEVLEAMLPYFSDKFGNAGGIYSPASESKAAIAKARAQAASLIGAKEKEIFFTSGGTESDNWAVFGVLDDCSGHVITSGIEHPAVMNTLKYLESKGLRVTFLPVDAEGFVSPKDVEAAICPNTRLITIMTANNETGSVQPIREIGQIAHAHGILFHTDAVQAYGQIPLDVNELGVDLLSASGHKLGGPKGIGILYIRDGVRFGSFHHGGAQERSRRAGTENVPGIVGFGAAAELAGNRMEEKRAKECALRELLYREITTRIPDAILNGPAPGDRRLPGNLNFSFPGVEGESLLIRLDMAGICASSGSACSTGAAEPSHVLTAIGRTPAQAKGSLRLTLSYENTEEEIRTAADIIVREVTALRKLRNE